MKNQFEYKEITANGNKRKGAELLINNEGIWQYFVNSQPVVEILRMGKNSNTAGGASSVGYQIKDKPETRKKTLKALIESLTN